MSSIDRDGDRILSQSSERWILWSSAGRHPVATGAYSNQSFPKDVALHGSHFLVVASPDTLELRHADDGRLLTTMQAGPSIRKAGLSTDGSYAYSLEEAHLRAYALDGKRLFERAGEYKDVMVVALADRLQVVRSQQRSLDGGGGEEVSLNSVDLTGNSLATHTVPGRFHGLFTDGSHVITRDRAQYHVYDFAGTKVRSLPVEQVPVPQEGENVYARVSGGGHGDFVWLQAYVVSSGELTANSTHVYRLSDPDWVKTFVGYPRVGEGGSLAFQVEQQLQRLDLDADEPRVVEDVLPGGFGLAYASEGDRWSVAVGSQVYDDVPGAARFLGCGALTSLHGSRVGRVAIGTQGSTLRLAETRSAPGEPVPTLDVRGPIFLSNDGQFVIGGQPLSAIALPSGEVLHAWTGSTFYSPAASLDGARIARRDCGISKTVMLTPEATASCALEVSNGAGEPRFTTPRLNMGGRLMFSPSGRRIAVTTVSGDVPTLVFEEAQQVGGYARAVLGWLDDERLLTAADSPGKHTVLDPTGKAVASLALDAVRGTVTAVDADRIYLRTHSIACRTVPFYSALPGPLTAPWLATRSCSRRPDASTVDHFAELHYLARAGKRRRQSSSARRTASRSAGTSSASNQG